MKIIISIFLLLFASITFGQVDFALIKYESSTLGDFGKGDTIHINGQKITIKDTIYKKIQLNNDFDSCAFIINQDTLIFYTKFKPNTEYQVIGSYCCYPITITTKDLLKYGSVKYINNSNYDIFYFDEMFNLKNIPSGATRTKMISNGVSDRPIAINPLLDTKLNAAGQRFSYMFLHGEKIEIDFSDSLDFNFTGYLSKKEFKIWLKSGRRVLLMKNNYAQHSV